MRIKKRFYKVKVGNDWPIRLTYFQVTLNTDLRFEQFYKKIEHFSRESFHAECDMSIVVVMSHGNKDGFYTTDGKVINRGWLIKQFTAASSPQLMNKPKLFIFSACRCKNWRTWVFKGFFKKGHSSFSLFSYFLTVNKCSIQKFTDD